MLLQNPLHLLIVLAHMLRIPAITAQHAIRKRRMLALERRISTAHDALSKVFKAVRQVPFHLLRDVLAGLETRVHLKDVVQTMQLVRHARGEDGAYLLVAFDWMREVVVLRGVLYVEIAQSLCATS